MQREASEGNYKQREACRNMRFSLIVLAVLAMPGAAEGQRRTAADSTQDSTVVLRPIEVSVTRQTISLYRIPFAVSTLDR